MKKRKWLAALFAAVVNAGGKATVDNRQDGGAPLDVRTEWNGYTWLAASETR